MKRERRYIAKCSCGAFTSGLAYDQDEHKYEHNESRQGQVFLTINGFIVLRCKGCQKVVRAKLVRGTFNPTHKCNDKCLSATGTTCECSCGGKNHGAGHQA